MNFSAQAPQVASPPKKSAANQERSDGAHSLCGTAPERVIRELLSRAGIKYRMNVRDLPGKPDFANKRRKFAIFAHGCFWHSHENCALASDPKSNRGYWAPKLERTKSRDRIHVRALTDRGYRVPIIWECSARTPHRAAELIAAFFRDAE
jgi:DNA mismatch endonuclease (patch repair protein)